MVSSPTLLVLFCVLGIGVLASYVVAIRGKTRDEIEALFAGATGLAKLPFMIMPALCVSH